jgi:hypothetical protein
MLKVRPVALPPASDALGNRLRELVRTDVGRLRSYLGGDFDGWGIG